MSKNTKLKMQIPTDDRPRQAESNNNLNEQAAERKVVSILFLSLDQQADKN